MFITHVFESIKITNDYKLYTLSQILYHAAPTIFSDKPSTIINFNNIENSFYAILPSVKLELFKKYHLLSFELLRKDNRCVILFYKKDLLLNAFNNNINFLTAFGFDRNMKLSDVFSLLKQKFSYRCPHEIGIFLGIPKEDVMAFISNNIPCKFCGYWKVYYDVEQAKEIFLKYDEAKLIAINYIENSLIYSS
ncbi:hypothetical protein ABG79_00438 [Caloramator mitchellensis]|uniref:DUF3793 domain-containing protein n=1 Tax=Caloramator mitchellensis TaxID=908809 RepID=A0A0R3K3K9_CALMK|nr:DUF3793 family protein [Caloramator mitchellensis]KRQ87637.1 hypothetical protein ABG79_00438 [Caloramator mitchellensis]